MPSATIRIFLVHGDPKRLRTAELSNWTGKAVAGPRSEFDSVLARDESTKSGVYFLTGVDPERGQPAVYIGEAECIRDRIKVHLAKDYWNTIVFFTSKDENLTKAHIRYLEGRLIENAREIGRAIVMNGQSSGSRLPESDREDMEIFLQKIHQLLPALGVEVFVPTRAIESPFSKRRLLTCGLKGISAQGYATPNGIVVLEGSRAVAELRPSAQGSVGLVKSRTQLQADGALVQDGDHLRFTRDVEFPSASAAASLIHGGPVNGLSAWKDQAGVSLKDLESL
jgi:hypothetical protein